MGANRYNLVPPVFGKDYLFLSLSNDDTSKYLDGMAFKKTALIQSVLARSPVIG